MTSDNDPDFLPKLETAGSVLQTHEATKPDRETLGMATNSNGKSANRGFASMDREQQREIASKGGKAAHKSGNAHEFTSEEARKAGKEAHRSGNAHEFTSEEARKAGQKGGKVAHERGTAHEFTSDEARKAGKKGGQNSHGGRGQ